MGRTSELAGTDQGQLRDDGTLEVQQDTRSEQTHAAAGAAAVNRIAEAGTKISPSRVRLEIFPGEWADQVSVTGDDGKPMVCARDMGHLYVYVDNKLKTSYEVAGGMAPGNRFVQDDGHVADATPDGKYVLGGAEHHTTPNWPMSTIPWGAKMRRGANGYVEFSPDEGKSWRVATGPNGVMTAAMLKAANITERTLARREKRKPVSIAYSSNVETEMIALIMMCHDNAFPTVWQANDFGNWAFNLTIGGQRSPIYIHTTPEDEKAYSQGVRLPLMNSHGCVHMHPVDVAEMMNEGYLQKSVSVVVKKYGERGPAAPQTTARA